MTPPIIDVATQHVFGLDFVSEADIAPVAERLFGARDDRSAGWRCVVTPNVDHLVRYRRHPVEARVATAAGLVLPDGMPIVWASRLLGRPLAARLTGADLFATLWALLVEHDVPVVMILPDHHIAERLQADHPSLQTIIPPMFQVDDDAVVERLLDETSRLCAATDARFLVVGISMPKHHLVADRLRQRWDGAFEGTPTVLLLGQSPEFAVGAVRRAPAWMQRCGLEWLWRLAGDPRRLARRYLIDDVAFLGLLWREWRSSAARSSAATTE